MEKKTILKACEKAVDLYSNFDYTNNQLENEINAYLSNYETLYKDCLKISNTEYCLQCRKQKKEGLPYDCLLEPDYCKRKGINLMLKFIYSYEDVLNIKLDN